MIPRSFGRLFHSELPSLLGCSQLFQQSRRTVLLPPQYWYFVDTEGNLTFNPPRKRYLNDQPPPSVQQRARFSLENVENLLQELQGDTPMKEMPNPYKKKKDQCVLCKYGIEPDYKNARLLSQFVSRFTGRMYDRQTTGLCRRQQEQVELCIKMSRMAGFMPKLLVEPVFYGDPRLFDPFNPKRKS